MTSASDASVDDDFELALDAEGAQAAAARGSFVIAAAQIIKTGVMFASQIILARLLLPSDFGLVAMVGPLVTFTLILNSMGLAESLVQAQSLDQRRVSAVFWGSLSISVALALVVAALGPLVSHLYGDARLTGLVLASALAIPVATAGSVPSALLVRRMQFRRLQSTELATTTGGIVVTIALASVGFGYWSLTIGGLFSSALSVIILWQMAGWRPSRPHNIRAAADDLSFGLNLTGANLSTFVTTTADNIIIGALLGPSALGYYDRSYRLVVQPISQLLAPVGGVSVPLLSRLQDDGATYRSTYFRLLRSGLLLTLPISLFCIAFGDQLIVFLLGDRWAATSSTFRWISVGGLGSALYTSLTWLFVSQRRTSAMRTAFFLTAIVNVGSFLLGTRWGIAGVAAAGAIGFLCVTVPTVIWYATLEGPVSSKALATILIPYMIAGTATLAVLNAARSLLPSEGIVGLGLGAAFTCAAFLAILGAFPRERSEMVVVARFIAHKLRSAAPRFARQV